LLAFTEETGIEVHYEEVVTDYPVMLAKILPLLTVGEPTGFDILVMGGRQLGILLANDWLVDLSAAPRTNFDANAADWVTMRNLDPTGRFTMPWQGGFTGVGVDREAVRGPITKLDDLANPDKVGLASVGMLKEDMPDFVMTNLGIDVASSGPDEWREAASWLLMQRDSGTVRGYYDVSYTADIENGNLVATMAWSGDIVYRRIWLGYPQWEFALLEDRGLVWSDDMVMPVPPDRAVDAITLMDYYYRPEIAKLVTEWVLFLSPVAGVREEVLKDAEQAAADGYRGYANKLRATAEDPHAFPDASLLASLSGLRIFSSDDELEEWNAIFSPISQS
jgi:spermidine/putrescine transport system substrate-binding protein